jgi:pyruvate formate lyase activating enzyme
MQEAMLYAPVIGGVGGVRCELCARRCVISEGKAGFCRVRQNIGNKLMTDAYGQVSVQIVDVIERKLCIHFYPNSYTFSFGTKSCTFRCKFCINYSLKR